MVEIKFDYPVQVNWNHQSDHWWNDTCAMVLEVFGLPGNRYIYHPHIDFMIFTFKKEMDAELCKILLSDRL